MTIEHTPGPWVVQERENYLIHIEHSLPHKPGAISLCLAKVVSRDTWVDESIANAKLIAAAPELLEALQEAREEVAYIASGMSHSLFKTNAAKCCLARIDKAIAKATKGDQDDPIQR